MIKDQYNSIEEYYLDAANKYVDYANDYFSEGALEPDLKRLKNFKDIDKFTVEFSLDTSKLAILCQFKYDNEKYGNPHNIDIVKASEPFIYLPNFNQRIMDIVESDCVGQLIDTAIEEAWRSYNKAEFHLDNYGNQVLSSEWCKFPAGTSHKKIEWELGLHSRGLNYLKNEYDPSASYRVSESSPTPQLNSEDLYAYYLTLDDLAARLFSVASSVYVSRESSEYIGGIDENGHERKDNFKPTSHSITYNSPLEDYPDVVLVEYSQKDYFDYEEPFGDPMSPSEAMENILRHIELSFSDDVRVYAKPKNNAAQIEIIPSDTSKAIEAVETTIKQLTTVNSRNHDLKKNTCERD